jgi:hypothetical protein
MKDKKTGGAIKLAPSDLTFLLNDCKRCFYLKVMKNIRRPSTPLFIQ